MSPLLAAREMPTKACNAARIRSASRSTGVTACPRGNCRCAAQCAGAVHASISVGNTCVAASGSHGCSDRSEEHTSELQSLMRNSYAVFCLKKKKNTTPHTKHTHQSKQKEK